MLNEDIIDKISNGPLVLFLGQNYLALEDGNDIFLNSILKKYGELDKPIKKNYDDILSLKLEKDSQASTSWMESLCKHISTPQWLEKIATIPWSAVYTSAFDTIVNKTLTLDWRKVQPIYDESFKVIDPRNKFNLHLTYLYGCINHTDPNKTNPLTFLEKTKRIHIRNRLFNRLPEIITPNGLIVFEGYDHNKDWLEFDLIYGLLSQLDSYQAIFCSVNEDLLNDDRFQDLIHSKKIKAYEENFAKIISNLEAQGKLNVTIPEFEDKLGKWLTIGDKAYKIPQDLIFSLTKSATIIDDSIFEDGSKFSEDENYIEFKNFLSSTNITTIWKGYSKGFAFKRDYYSNLKKEVVDRLKSNNRNESPIILHGQSSSGKTISLGNLVYELKTDYKLPILFIDKRFQKIDEHDIDRFCIWAEDNGARVSIIVWDGMVEIDLYYSLLRKLNARGRNVILIASAYLKNGDRKTSNYIESTVSLDKEEKFKFQKFVAKIDPILSNVISDFNEANILAMFYRYLPDSRYSIKSGLKNEFDHFTKLIREHKSQGEITEPGSKTTPMFQLMKSAGLIKEENFPDFNNIEIVDTDGVPLSDQLIYSVMVPGQFALNVPFELLLRSIGAEAFSSGPFRILNKVNIISWNEDMTGNITIGPRTAIEARILLDYLGGKRAEIEYIKGLLASIRSNDFTSYGYESNQEIQFAAELLNKIGPNSKTGGYTNFWYDITQELRKLREEGLAYHPRLILKEASFLREIVKNQVPKLSESYHDLLNRAEEIVTHALIELKNFHDLPLKNYLRVELATILGSKTRQFGKEKKSHSEAIKSYELIRQTIKTSFATNPENYGALDVLAWSTEFVIRNNILSPVEKIEAEATMLNLFEVAEIEGISDFHFEEFKSRKITFLELIGRQNHADEIFDALSQSGSTAGYYLRARNILLSYKDDSVISTEEKIKKYQSAFDYLNPYFEKIRHDSKCLFLLLKSWWIIKTKHSFFDREKATVQLSHKEWEYALKLIDFMLANDDLSDLATISYIKALAEFHVDEYALSMKTFRQLDILTDFSSYGRRRIIKSYISSNNDGMPRIYSGEVSYDVSINTKSFRGEVFVQELKMKIPFVLTDFHQASFQRGEILKEFYIGFNFRGPIAMPVKH